jgi:hypothetical protein
VLCIDFDGVIHPYPEDWRERLARRESTLQDDEIEGAFASLRELRKAGYVVVICTARKGLKAVRKWIAARAPDLADVEVTGRKPGAALYLDDRAVRFASWPEAMLDVYHLTDPTEKP